MLPPPKQPVVDANPQFAKLHDDLTKRVLNEDYSTRRKVGNEIVQQMKEVSGPNFNMSIQPLRTTAL